MYIAEINNRSALVKEAEAKIKTGVYVPKKCTGKKYSSHVWKTMRHLFDAATDQLIEHFYVCLKCDKVSSIRYSKDLKKN